MKRNWIFVVTALLLSTWLVNTELRLKWAEAQAPLQPVNAVETVAPIGVVNLLVLPRSTIAVRKGLLLINDGPLRAYCTFDGTPAILGKGHRFDAGGGVLYDRVIPMGPLNCISSGAGASLLVTEYR